MPTKQNDTAALTDEQLEGVAGGFDIGPISLRGSHVSISPVPTPIPGVRLISAAPLPSPHPRPWQTRVGSRSIDPIPFPYPNIGNP